MQYEPKFGRPGDRRQAWLVLQSKYQNISRQRRQTLLGRLDNSVMKADTDSAFFLSEINQIRHELSVLGKAVLTERLTIIILDTLPSVFGGIRSSVRYTEPLGFVQDTRDVMVLFDEWFEWLGVLTLERIQRMMRAIFINHSERLSVTKNNQESREKQQSNRRGWENDRKSAMSTTFTACHYCKKTSHKVRDCKIKLERENEVKSSGKSNHEREKKWC